MPHQVFLSYKREDEPRAARVARALERQGLAVWWDRQLPAGESWHSRIEAALEAAPCVVVLWSEGSVGPQGGYVRDEARRAHARGVLVPVLIDRVAPPLGLGEVQAVDLVRWGGSPRDPFLLDLVAAIRAKLEGRPVPPARGPQLRWARRLTAGGAVGALTTALVWALGTNAFGASERLCALPGPQPVLSDTCGALGLGARPTREERVAWEALEPGSCEALRQHVARFPNGAMRPVAAQLVGTALTVMGATFEPRPRPVRSYVRHGEHGHRDEAAARAQALERVRDDATRACQPIDEHERLAGVEVVKADYDCRARGSAVTCSADYEARCLIERRPVVERCADARSASGAAGAGSAAR